MKDRYISVKALENLRPYSIVVIYHERDGARYARYARNENEYFTMMVGIVEGDFMIDEHRSHLERKEILKGEFVLINIIYCS